MGVKVSFAVAVYNTAPFTEQLVRSLYEQTLEDIEIVLVDDCTPDDSIDIALRILEEYPKRKSQVKVIHHEQNVGISKTKRDCILGSSGEYVIVIDGDDYLDTRMAELMYEKAQEANADMVFCDYYYVVGDKQYIRTLALDGIMGDGDNVRSDMINRRVPPFHWVKLVKRSLYLDNDVVWPLDGLGEDTVFNVVTAFYAKRIAHVAEPLYYYRYNNASYSHKKMPDSFYLKIRNDFQQNFELAWSVLEKAGVSEKYERGAIINKLRTKNRLLPIVGQCKYRKMWWNTYSEINKVLLFGNKYYKPTYKDWLWVASIMLGLYPRFKGKLRSKRFLPSNEWI